MLKVDNLVTSLHPGSRDQVDIVRSVSFSLEPGQILGVVGESGSGKSMMAYSLIDLLDRKIAITGGSIVFNGEDLSAAKQARMRELRGNRIAMIFQDPMVALNPVLTIGEQMIEAIQAHRRMSRRDAEAHAIKTLARVGIPSPESRMSAYAHEFSGGMRQRVVIAIAFLNEPDLIIADEATTALDVTIQSQILAEIQGLAEETGAAILWITHDLSLLSGFADAVMVMYAGQVIEIAPADRLFGAPRHPYTAALMRAVPVAGRTRLENLEGVPPSLADLPPGCAFAPRCPRAQPRCSQNVPPFEGDTTLGWRCFFPLEETP
ncbi:ABC transporter ATP-binding protein [Marivita sp. GX14005]|uniref:ABC transporter ATP-binding protein n=1 Tax=Marivita sp. GX14005 TaxID=2942276 RepID=UPI002019A727|nr:ABC transporter ATP-binding protein [Marivita sp. GX14005]MCL3883334.1 ABC transporter ATP-binding protein [Marivita sp. GX14005]